METVRALLRRGGSFLDVYPASLGRAVGLPVHSGASPSLAMAPTARFGDLLPLPMEPSVASLGPRPRGRRSQQRVGRRRAIDQRVRETIVALNEGGGFADDSGWPRQPRRQATLNTQML